MIHLSCFFSLLSLSSSSLPLSFSSSSSSSPPSHIQNIFD